MEVIVFPTTLKGPGSSLTDDFETFFLPKEILQRSQYIQQLKADSSGWDRGLTAAPPSEALFFYPLPHIMEDIPIGTPGSSAERGLKTTAYEKTCERENHTWRIITEGSIASCLYFGELWFINQIRNYHHFSPEGSLSQRCRIRTKYIYSIASVAILNLGNIVFPFWFYLSFQIRYISLC